jgi:dihydrofolate synthase / folylpolyglutamate synthase
MNDIRKYFNYLFGLERSSMKYNLSNISKLLKAEGNPHYKTKYIHIAGTNGKGGTASFLSSILTEHGLKTGLFTSPHILRFNERIRTNGKTISDSYIKKYLERNKNIIKAIKPSFFEVNTAIALKYFADKKTDIAVIEAGLGGRLDSTNVINPELIIITQIEIDHTDYLGNTIENIAKEKLGIVKPGIDVIINDTNNNLRKIFISKIKPSRLFFLDKQIKIFRFKSVNRKVKYLLKRKSGGKQLSVYSPLPGSYQARNLAAAILAAEMYLGKIKRKLDLALVKKALSNLVINTGYRCRLETIKLGMVNFILDVSHNPAGIKSALDNFSDNTPEVIIFAMMNDKDYKKAIHIILRTGSRVIFTQPEYKRAVPATELYKYANKSKYKRNENLYLTENVSDAIRLSKIYTGKKGTILIIGSFFLVSDAIKNLSIQKLFR